MKALFLAAGKGSRLGSLTDDTPKSLLPICNGTQTLLSYNLNNLYDFGVTDFLLITGFMHQKIEEYVNLWSSNKNVTIQFIYNPFWQQCNVLGSFYCALNMIDDDFLYLHADTVVEQDVWRRLNDVAKDYVLAVDLKKCGEEEMKVSFDRGRLIDISKTIPLNDAAGEFVGVAKFSKNTLSFFYEMAIRLFEEKGLFLYMEETLMTGLKENRINVDWVDVSDLATIEVDFIEDLDKAKDIFR
ncbi:MAG: phosphocholine cytidylyltransferase family protein [Mediterranea sp.]|jgi:choline kinase|nr:phosphocholine cytidylyltransferase family protein [Mediterranea sp.]